MTTQSRIDETVSAILERRLSAILRTHDQQLAERAMQAAVNGGFRLAEFTLTTPGAFDLISTFARDERLVVGAGTVLTVDDARRATEAGARFLVSPITDGDIIEAAHRFGAACIPGAVTPTEMVAAHRLGADLIKFFPAQGDVADYVRSIRGPLPHLRIFPTSGVTEDNFKAILDAGAVGVGFVGGLFAPVDMASENFQFIEERAARIHVQLT